MSAHRGQLEVADVVTHQVGDDGRVARIRLPGDAGFNLADRGQRPRRLHLGIDAAAKLGKERDERSAESESDQLIWRGFLRMIESAKDEEEQADLPSRRARQPPAR